MTTIPLPRFVDEKIAKGVVRQELREVRGGDRMTTFAKDVLLKDVMEVTARGRKLTDAAMDEVAGKIARGFADKASCIHVERLKARRPMTSAKNYRYVKGHFVSVPPGGVANLGTVRVRIVPKGCCLAFSSSPFSFVEHAAERLLQRLPQDKPRDPLRTIGKLLLASSNFLAPALRIADMIPNKALAVPFGEGMLLGEVRRIPRREMRAGGFEQSGNSGSPLQVGSINPTMVPHKENVLDLSETLMFLAKTYIGPNEVRHEQRVFLDKVAGLQERHAGVFDSDGWATLYPGAPAQELLDALSDGLRAYPGKERMDAAYADFLDMFRDKAILKAIGATGEPTAAPMPYWDYGDAFQERIKRMSETEKVEYFASRQTVMPGEDDPIPTFGR